jgi:RNA polymerase sigma-70 factor (ECF subfamily)
MDDRELAHSVLKGGRFRSKARLDSDLRPGELDAVVRLARAGDERAIAYIYARFSGNVYGYVRSLVRDDHDAEDLTQQVFARVLPALATYESRGVPFSSWLLRVARNVTIDHVRRRATLPRPAEPVDRPDEARGRELAGVIDDAIRALPDGQREVVVLRHIVGLAPEEIAGVLQTSEASVNGLGHRGRRALRTLLIEAGAGPTTCAGPPGGKRAARARHAA